MHFKDAPNFSVPSFFRACCVTASKGRLGNYHSAGYELARNFASTVNFDDFEEYGQICKELEGRIMSKQRSEAILLLKELIPSCIQLVPPRKLNKLLDGMSQAVHDGLVD
jgi:hypothetical protein